MSSQRRTFATTLSQRLPHDLFAALFLLYVVGAVGWLLLGLATGLAAAATGFYQLLVAWSQRVNRDSALADVIRLIRFSSIYTQPPHYYLFYYLFSVVNLVAALGIVWLRRRDWVARALAVGMVGTAAVFNWPAHAVLDFSSPLINDWHTNYHLISGLAYAIGSAFFPDGTLPDLPFAQRLPWRGLREGLRLGYVLLLFGLGFGAANVIRHAQAQRCIITLQIANRHLLLTICDDGKGFIRDHVAGVGLRSMSERTEELGGLFRVAAPTNGGTEITAHLPLVVAAFPKLFVSTKEDVV